MDRSSILIVIALAAILFVIGLLSGPGQRSAPQLPPVWEIQTGNGHTEIFGIQIGTTPLKELEARIGEAAEIALFRREERAMAEGYFERVLAGQIQGRLVLELQSDPDTAEALLKRAQPGSINQPHGHTLRPHPEDRERLRQARIRSVTFLPRLRLSDEMLLQRFGPPAQKIQLSDDGPIHWLYPQRGLDIARQGRHTIMQIVAIDEFERLQRPLIAKPTEAPATSH